MWEYTVISTLCFPGLASIMSGDSTTLSAESELSSQITIPFHTAKEAEIAWNTLRVDREPPRGGCTKTMCVKGKTSFPQSRQIVGLPQILI